MKALGVTIFSLLALLSYADASSILRPGDRLNSSRNLVSDSGNFTLGFFNTAVTNYSYIGIWYTNDHVDPPGKVWVANPNTPLINNSGVLTIDSSGTLKIINGGNTVMNISDHVGTSNTSAMLKDSGNFVLLDAVDNRTLWQSFDHPTDTLLPGMKLGFNRTTGENWTLNSWLSDGIPASGAFILGLEGIQGSGRLVIRRRGELYWTSGPWINYTFQYFQSALTDFNIWFDTIVSHDDAMYLTLDGTGSNTLMKLNSMGQITFSEVSSGSTTFLLCYHCVPSAVPEPTCRSPDDSFVLSTGFIFPRSWDAYRGNSNLSLANCKQLCWNNCYCVAFAALYPNGTGCILWATTGNCDSYTEEKGETFVLESLAEADAAKARAWMIPVLLLLGLLSLSVLATVIGVLRDKKRRRKEFLRQLKTLDGLNDGTETGKNGREPHDLRIFSFGSIMVATNNFSSENKLGEGGFGPVYKGRLVDGREIAVKRLSTASAQGIQEFKNELILSRPQIRPLGLRDATATSLREQLLLSPQGSKTKAKTKKSHKVTHQSTKTIKAGYL